MEEKLYGSVPVPSEYLQQWIQSAQQLQALQGQYPGINHHHSPHPHYTEEPREERVMAHAHMAVNDELMAQQEPANLAKAPAKKRGRTAQPKEPKPPKMPKPPKEPKAKPGPKPKKGKEGQEADGTQEKMDETVQKVRKKRDRFKGMTEDEVMSRTLTDILDYNLDYVIIGINPGLVAAYVGRWFPGPGNHFWKCLFLSGFTDEQLNHMSDTSLPAKYKIGFTNMVARTTPGSKDLSTKELREGALILVEKLKKYKPLIAVFNGKCIYEMFCREMFGKKPKKLDFGLQPHKIPDCEVVAELEWCLSDHETSRKSLLSKTVQTIWVTNVTQLWKGEILTNTMVFSVLLYDPHKCHGTRLKALYLMPSSSARCAQFPRAQDKVHFYIKLRELRDQLKGVARTDDIQELEYTFDLGLAKEDAKRMAIKEEAYDPGYEAAFGGAYGEGGPGPEEGQSNGNGHCNFSSAENTVSDAVEKADTSQLPAAAATEGQLPDGQWMMQSFADQIPDIGGSKEPQAWAGNV